MPSYLILDLNSRYCDGYYFQTSAASNALAYHRERWPDGRFVMAELRQETDRPKNETLLPGVLQERQRLTSASTV
jgi:hypothetical protein